MDFAAGGTHTLFCQIATAVSSGRVSVERQFSVVPDFKSGGTPYDLGKLTVVIGEALEQQLNQLNASKNTWVVSSCCFIDQRSFGFMLRCVPNAKEMDRRKDALAELGSKPLMLHHLQRENSTYVEKFKIPIDRLPSSVRFPYNRLDPKATKAIASLVSRANGDEPDLTRHPWALLGVWGLSAPAPQTPAPEGAIVILEWQPVR